MSRAVAPPVGRPRSNRSERQLVGLFSLGLGVLLLVLILVRGQQAAREGNQEVRNDTYWVLVSPLVFSAFGVTLLRAPKGRAARRGSRRVEQPVVMRPKVSRALEWSERSASADAATTQQLSQARQQLSESLKASQEAQALVEHLEQGVFGVTVPSGAPAPGDPFPSSYPGGL